MSGVIFNLDLTLVGVLTLPMLVTVGYDHCQRALGLRPFIQGASVMEVVDLAPFPWDAAESHASSWWSSLVDSQTHWWIHFLLMNSFGSLQNTSPLLRDLIMKTPWAASRKVSALKTCHSPGWHSISINADHQTINLEWYGMITPSCSQHSDNFQLYIINSLSGNIPTIPAALRKLPKRSLEFSRGSKSSAPRVLVILSIWRAAIYCMVSQKIPSALYSTVPDRKLCIDYIDSYQSGFSRWACHQPSSAT